MLRKSERISCPKCKFASVITAAAISFSLAPEKTASAGEKVFACNQVDVAFFPNARVHVKCTPADGNIAWFALGLADEGNANRALSILSTALVAKKRLDIWYDPADTSADSIGCAVSNCRLLHAIVMYQ